MEKNLTTGSVLKSILYFSLPYLLSYFLQTLYGMADLFIIGQFEDISSITAVSIGSQVMHMITVMIVGLAMGATVNIGQAIGAGNKKKAAKDIGNTVTLFMMLAIAGAAGLLFFIKPIVGMMSTPQEAVHETVIYLTICFLGIPFITAYNIISSIFRGIGDSKSPMYFIAVACAINIILDYLFIGGLHMGAAGAALGTTCSQTISVLIALVVIMKKKTGIALSKNDFKIDRKTIKRLLNRYSCCAAGWIYPDCFYNYHYYCKQAGTRYCCGGRNCRKNYQFPLSGTIFYAFYCICTWSAEYRCR